MALPNQHQVSNLHQGTKVHRHIFLEVRGRTGDASYGFDRRVYRIEILDQKAIRQNRVAWWVLQIPQRVAPTNFEEGNWTKRCTVSNESVNAKKQRSFRGQPSSEIHAPEAKQRVDDPWHPEVLGPKSKQIRRRTKRWADEREIWHFSWTIPTVLQYEQRIENGPV